MHRDVAISTLLPNAIFMPFPTFPAAAKTILLSSAGIIFPHRRFIQEEVSKNP